MNISASIRKLTLLFIGLFMALSGGLVYWQVMVANAVTDNVHNGRSCLSTSAPVRGKIFDRNGVLLAESKPSPEGQCGYLRVYYEPSLAGLIGYYISPLYEATGIERAYDQYLSGQVGMTSLDNTINEVLHRPPIGDDIYLTIDVRIQRSVKDHFDDPINIDNRNTFQTNRGSVVVMNPHTGEVLAMLSEPGYDPNKLVKTISKGDFSYFDDLNKDRSRPLRLRPIQDTYIPGSVYKAVTLMAGLDSGATTLQQPFNEKEARGPIFINGQQFGPVGNNIDGYTFRFPVNTEYGFAHSDNVIFAQIGVKTGYDKWMDYNKKFFVGEKIPFDLPVQPSTVLKDGKELADNELAANAFGQGYNSVTTLQMSLFDNAIASEGKLMKPYLVTKIVDPDKNPVVTNGPSSLGNQVSSQTAAQLRQSMFGVARCGSGSIVPSLFFSKWGIIEKTGTAQVDTAGKIPAHSWILSQAPYSFNNTSQLPAVTIVAMKENGGEGGPTVGPMVASIYDDIFSKGFVKVQQPTPAPQGYCCSSQLLQRGC